MSRFFPSKRSEDEYETIYETEYGSEEHEGEEGDGTAERAGPMPEMQSKGHLREVGATQQQQQQQQGSMKMMGEDDLQKASPQPELEPLHAASEVSAQAHPPISPPLPPLSISHPLGYPEKVDEAFSRSFNYPSTLGPFSPQARQKQRRQMHTVTPLAPGTPSCSASSTGEGWAWQPSSAGGWAVAVAVFLAIRLSRERTDKHGLDLHTLQQLRQQDSRVQSTELRAKRRQFLEEERERKQAEAEVKVKVMKRAAEEAERRRAAEAEAKAKAMAVETSRLWQEQEKAKQAFIEQNALMAEELKRRTEMEMRLKEEAEKQRAMEAAEEEEQRKASAAAAAEQRAKQEAAEAEERRRLEAQIESERAALRHLQTTFVLKFEGKASVEPSPFNTLTSDDIPQLARFHLQLQLKPRSLERLGGAEAERGAMIEAEKGSMSEAGSGTMSEVGRGTMSEVGRGTISELFSELPAQSVAADFASVESCIEESDRLADSICKAAIAKTAEAIRQLPPTVGGPMSLMSDSELLLWMHTALIRADLAVVRAVSLLAPLADSSSHLEQPLPDISVSRSVLPPQHPQRLEILLNTVAHQLGDESKLTQAAELLERIISREEDPELINVLPSEASVRLASMSRSDSSSSSRSSGQGGNRSGRRSSLGEAGREVWSRSNSNSNSQLPPMAAAALVYALLLDLVEQPASSSNSSNNSGKQEELNSGDSSNGGSSSDSSSNSSGKQEEQSSSDSSDGGSGRSSNSRRARLMVVIKTQLKMRGRNLPENALIPTARAISLALGTGHPISEIINELAERNMSAVARHKREVRARRQERELERRQAAEQDEKRVNGKKLDPSDPSQRQALVPVPERLWAARNVANNLVRYGEARQLGEAVGMLEQASTIAGEHYGAGHPAQLAVLLDLQEGLKAAVMEESESSSEWMGKLVAVSERLLDVVQGIIVRYQKHSDPCSAALLAQASLINVRDILPASHPQVVELRELSDNLLASMDTAVAAKLVKKVQEKRNLLSSLAKDFTEELGVYALTKKRSSRLDQWNKGLPLTAVN